MSNKKVNEVEKIADVLKEIISELNLGEITIEESSDAIISLNLKGHSSSKDLIGKGIESEGNFCSFEAGMLAGIVEKASNIHCFAQELSCGVQSGKEHCQFMIVFQKE